MTRTVAIFLLCAAPGLALAQGGSNIGLAQYPAPACQKPSAPADALKPAAPPENPTDNQAIAYNKKVDAYNAAMRAHNEQATAFGACINAYIANGNADMQRIRAALDAAVASANAR